MITLRKVSDKTFPATSNALVVRHLVIHQTASDVVLGFIRWAIGHPPKDDPDPIAGVTGWTLSLHETKLLRVTDKSGATSPHLSVIRVVPPGLFTVYFIVAFQDFRTHCIERFCAVVLLIFSAPSHNTNHKSFVVHKGSTAIAA
jgi:hypothetical protein